VNKNIEGKQCTIIWHVDDLKVSHRKKELVEDILKKLTNLDQKPTHNMSGTSSTIPGDENQL